MADAEQFERAGAAIAKNKTVVVAALVSLASHWPAEGEDHGQNRPVALELPPTQTIDMTALHEEIRLQDVTGKESASSDSGRRSVPD